MTDVHHPIADTLLTRNARYASDFHDSDLAVEPKPGLAIVACMDSRIDAFAVLGQSSDANEDHDPGPDRS